MVIIQNMAANGHCFVEWKEQFVSKERGNRVVHYFLKDISGESILAVVGTERSVRHMFYVVSEEFLNVRGADNSVHAGFRWRSRREVVNWLTSRLSKQHRHSDRSNKLQKDDLIAEASGEQTPLPDYRGSLARNLKGHSSDIAWSGVSWTCGKQLKHYPAFCRNGIKIAIHSFVFVMAEEGNHYLAYIEDMYEDRKEQKKVKVRWFHRTQEIKRVISLRNPHPKEVFITPYAQVISVECVDGSAIVLAPEDYEKCLAGFPSTLVARLHLCYRQFKSNRVKPFKLSKLRGYFDQPIFSCLDPEFDDEELSPGDNVQVGVRRARRAREWQMLTYESSFRNLKRRRLISHNFKVDEKVELLCQDSGIRGCWFRCTVLQVSQRQLKVQYDDLKDEDGCGNLEEWVPAFRLAMPDKLGMRCPSRQTIRPSLSHDQIDLSLEVGAPVDAWWSDGWWEGVVTGIVDSGDESLQVYVPGEDLLLSVSRKNLRVSRDWMGDQWVDIEANRDILSAISAVVSQDTKVTASPTIVKEPNSDDLLKLCHEAPICTKLDVVEEKVEPLDDFVPCDYVSRDMDQVNDEKQLVVEERDDSNTGDESPEKDNAEHAHSNHDNVEEQNDDDDDDTDNGGGVGDGDRDVDENGHTLDEFETAGQKCEAELLEVVA
ncbi:hypothetical protein RHMOL_Rhmol06G0310500 [Rhododendron molle]|uniref:Uncharacterized protein n=1 Tax=Rhododendron molle TaxID=49168 RepID=A0ACC0NJ10_RHOML|nr:hypothetical protein RHMOL_Rhmol06G0310500 [Rhododendron molle]